jgi:hypothetical protein
MTDLWTWREVVVVITPVGGGDGAPTNPIQDTDVTGFDVEATDGHIGKVDEATYRPAAAISSSTPASGSSGRSA